MKIALLIGSVRSGRQSHKIACYLEKRILQKGLLTDVIDLAEMNGHMEAAEDFHDISIRLENADALILITPEYHGSYSGILKIVLDNVWTSFNRKPVGVVAVSSGKMGGILASAQLQHVVLSIGAYAIPYRLLIPEVQNAFDENFQLVNERTLKCAEKFLEEYCWFANAIREKKIKDQAPAPAALPK